MGNQEMKELKTINKFGSVDWTVGKLMSIIFLAVFLALVIYGVSTGGLTPLYEKVAGYFDNVAATIYSLFGGDYGSVEERGIDVYIDGVGNAELFVDGECRVRLDSAVSAGTEDIDEFKFNNNLFGKIEERWVNLHTEGYVIFDYEDDVRKEVYEKLSPVYAEVFNSVFGKDSFEGFAMSRTYLEFVVRGWVDNDYFKWDENVWYFKESNDEQWEEKEWTNADAVNEIENSVTGIIADSKIFWKDSEEGDFKLIDDFGMGVFNDKVEQFKEVERRKEGLLKNLREALGERKVTIDGEEKKLDFEINEWKYGIILYYSPQHREWGVVYLGLGVKMLKVVEYVSGDWKGKDSATLWQKGKYEDAVIITKIYNFLNEKC